MFNNFFSRCRLQDNVEENGQNGITGQATDNNMKTLQTHTQNV